MNNQNYKEGKASTVLITIGVIVGILIVIGLFSSNTPSQQADSQNNNAPAPVTEASIAMKSKCATDGKAYYQDFYKQFTRVKSIWFDPQFHFNSKLNTCLVYISWNDTSIPNNMYWSSDNKYLNSTQIVTNNNIVFDVYSNQAVLQNSTVRTYTNLDGVKDEKDVLSDYPYAQNIPNTNGTDFGNQLNVLMSQ